MIHFSKAHLKAKVFVFVLAANLFILSTEARADYFYDFVSLEIARAYIYQNPYLMYISHSDEFPSHLFRVDSVYMDQSRMMVTGQLILTWSRQPGHQINYQLANADDTYTEELCGNYHYGYYNTMRVAVPLMNLLNPVGGEYMNSVHAHGYPSPEVIPDVEKNYSTWMEHLPINIREYCEWWYKNASLGPPPMHELIDSVLSAPEGGRKAAPDLWVDYNTCPGEGCMYGEWKTSEELIVFKEPNSNTGVGKLAKGETFTALTGNVYLTPLEQIAYENIYVYDSLGSIVLEPGRRYYILSNMGEGHSKVWVNGRIMILPDSPYNNSQQWWIEVQPRKGKKGWIPYPESGCISGSDYLE